MVAFHCLLASLEALIGEKNSPCQYQNKYMTGKVRRSWELM